jgi:hypothetical protein
MKCHSNMAHENIVRLRRGRLTRSFAVPHLLIQISIPRTTRFNDPSVSKLSKKCRSAIGDFVPVMLLLLILYKVLRDKDIPVSHRDHGSSVGHLSSQTARLPSPGFELES